MKNHQRKPHQRHQAIVDRAEPYRLRTRAFLLGTLALGLAVGATVVVKAFSGKPISATAEVAPRVTTSASSSVDAAASTSTPTTPGVWHDDFLRAAIIAGSERKGLLVLFAGPDTIQHPAELALQDPRVIADAAADFVLVRLDPTTARVSPAALNRTVDWMQRLNVSDLPCIATFDSAQKPCAIIRQSPQTVDAALAAIASARKARVTRDHSLEVASRATGVDRARALDAALSSSNDEHIAACYPEQMAEIVRLDANGAAGLRERYATRVDGRAVDQAIQQIVYPMIDAGDLTGAADQLARLAREYPADVERRQLLLAFQAQLRASAGSRDKALELMDQAIAVAPATSAADRVRAARATLAN